MKIPASLFVAAVAMLMMARVAAGQQAAASADAEKMAEMGPVTNPVSATVRGQLARFSKNIVAAAEAMPAGENVFKPSPEMKTFGHLAVHIAQTNNVLCSKISGAAGPGGEYSESGPKGKPGA